MKLLIFAPYGIGNLILLYPVLKALKKQNIPFDIVSFLGSVDYMLTQWPEFNTLYENKWKLVGSKKEILTELQKIRKTKYDLSILSFPSAKPHYNLLSFLCGAKKKVGSRYEDDSLKTLSFLNTIPVPVKENIHDVFQNLDLFREGGVVLDESDISPVPLNTPKGKVIGFHLGCSAGGAYKRWPLTKWDELVSQLKVNYPEYTLRLFFGPDEQEELRYFENNAHVEIVTGLSLTTLKDKIGESTLFISNDSGLMHIASFMGVPGIAVIGPSDEKRTGPYSEISKVFTGECDVRPCSHSYSLKSHRFNCVYNEQTCLTSIPVESVVAEVENILSKH